MGKRYSDEELIQKLKDFYEEHGQVVAKDLSSKNNMPDDGIYIRRFGSLLTAKELAGIPFKKRKPVKWTKEKIKEAYICVVDKLGHIPLYNELDSLKEFPHRKIIYNYYSNYEDLINDCGLTTNKGKHGSYKKDFLISEIQRFVKEFNRVPTQADFEKLEGYPSRKTFTNHFGNFNDVIRLSGFEPVTLSMKEQNKLITERATKENIIQIINTYIKQNNRIPKFWELIEQVGHSFKGDIKKNFGTWNKCLKELNLPINHASQYDDEFLESEFRRFVKENGRVPTYGEFNNSEYPSFWCYQNRFGSWNKAVKAYGFEINDKNRKYELDDGEICASSYEFDISTWLKKHNIYYTRNLKYKDFIDNYKGKMDCDYVIPYDNKIWYVEMAGFLRGTNFEKFSSEERNYFFKLKYKKKLLKRQKVNYVIIYPDTLSSKSFEEIFYFLNIKQ